MTNGPKVMIYLTLLYFLLQHLQEYSKIWNICFDIQLFIDKMRKVKKKGKKLDPPSLGVEPQIFEQNFHAQDLSFERD